MRVNKLKIQNIGKISNEEIIIDKPLIIFWGDVKQGKSTIINSVRWVCGGEFPADVIKHGEAEALIELHFEGGMIARSFYRAKDGVTKARPVVFVRNGKPVPSPVAEIKRMLNPFLLDQDFLRNKSELERKQYFTELFAVDTTTLDTELFNNQRDASTLRAKIAGYGEIDTKKVERVEISALQAKLAGIRETYHAQKRELEGQLSQMSLKHQNECEAVETENDAIRRHNASVERAEINKTDIQDEIESHKQIIAELEKQLKAIVVGEKKPLKTRPANPDYSERQAKIIELEPDTAELEKQIQEAGATNVRAEQYEKNMERLKEKQSDEEKLSALEKRGREIKAEKQARLKSIGDTCGIVGLEFDEQGNFIYDGTTAGMISDSQLIRLSSELSALYPEGFGISLLDRGESLGKSIFDYVALAEKNKSSILATIVGERPASVPENIGVFVVENGKVTP